MKTLRYLLFIALLIYSLDSQAQYIWEEVVLPDTVGVNMIAFDSIGNQFIASDKGVYYSENGYDWVQTSLSDYESYICINENNTIYAGMEYLYRSFDYGITWDSIYHSPEGGIMSVCTKGDSNVFIGTWGGIYRSLDSGQTWLHVLDSYNSEVFNAIVHNNDATFYAGSTSFSSSGSAGGIYRSDNNGETWLLTGLDYHFVSSIVINSEDEIYAGTRGHYFTGGSGVFKSYDNGISWDTIYKYNLIASMDINNINDIAVGCDSQEGEQGGILVSYNGGDDWEDITNNLPIQAFNQVIFSPDYYLFAVTHLGGRLFKTDTPVSIYERAKLDSFNNFKVFPNPADSFINIYLKDAKTYNISISDILGNQLVELDNIINSDLIVVNIENLSPGMYFIHFLNKYRISFTGGFLKY